MSSPNEPDFGGPHRPHVPRLDAVVAGHTARAGRAERRDDRARRHRLRHFGCYGSELATPTIDRLAANGLRYTSFHTTALCSPSRAALLTGRNPHAVGMRGVSNWNTGFPHMRGGISPRAATVAEMLRAHGYATYAAGKWHLAPMEECSAAGPHTNWPLQKGFDRFYGFLQGETDQFHPELTSDNGHIDPPGRPEDGYHVSEDIVDKATGWIGDLQSIRPDRPFFLYLAFGATHAPHQAPLEYRQRWRGKFDDGYGAARERWFARQLDLGIVPEGTTLAPPNPGVPAWNDLTDNQRAFAARLQGGVRGDARAHRRADRPARRLPRATRPARRHAPHGPVRQRRLPRGRAVRRHGRVQLLQRRVGGHRRHRRHPPRRHRRPALPLELPVGLGAGRELTAALVQAEHLRRRGA